MFEKFCDKSERLNNNLETLTRDRDHYSEFKLNFLIMNRNRCDFSAFLLKPSYLILRSYQDTYQLRGSFNYLEAARLYRLGWWYRSSNLIMNAPPLHNKHVEGRSFSDQMI